jgi:hypothetical protein
MLPPVLLTYLARLEALVVTANPGGGALRSPGITLPPAPPESRLVAAESGWRAGVGRLLHRVADRLTYGRGAASAGAPRLVDAQTQAQIRGLSGVLARLDSLAGERARLARRRRRGDREIFERFPLWVVPTYPGDAELFASAAFRDWLPADLRFEHATLAEVIAIGRAADPPGP